MSARVAVCVPAFDVMHYLGATIDSVMSQTLTDWELVIVDDASNDETAEIAEKYAALDERITVLHNERNLGAAANWNRAVAATTATLVKVLCGDDLLYPNCLETQVVAFENDTTGRLVMAASKRDIIGVDGQLIVASRGLAGLAGTVSGPEALQRCARAGTNIFGEPSQVLLRRTALEEAGGFDPRWRYMLDVECYRRILRHGDLAAIPETLGAFRYRPDGWSARLAHQQAKEARALLRELRAESGGAIGPLDIALGSARAGCWQLARRVVLARIGRAERRATRA